MAHGRAHRPPYYAARALAAWARQHLPYLRGRLLLSGVRVDELDGRDLLDVAEAVLLEPAMSGAWVSFDEVYEKVVEGYKGAATTQFQADDQVENFGRSREAIEAARRMEAQFPAPKPRGGE